MNKLSGKIIRVESTQTIALVEVAREALKVAVTEKKIKPKEIMQYAKACRVDRIIKPILEIML